MPVFIFILGNLIGYIFAFIWVRGAEKIKIRSVIRGYHFHHSLFFIPAFLLALYFSGNTALFFWGFGLGAVIQHTLEEGFIFITKE